MATTALQLRWRVSVTFILIIDNSWMSSPSRWSVDEKTIGPLDIWIDRFGSSKAAERSITMSQKSQMVASLLYNFWIRVILWQLWQRQIGRMMDIRTNNLLETSLWGVNLTLGNLNILAIKNLKNIRDYSHYFLYLNYSHYFSHLK